MIRIPIDARAMVLALAVCLGLTTLEPASAQDSGRLLATTGVTEIDGAGGGGLTPWAMIAGYGTRDSIGADTHYTLVYLPDFTLHSAGAAIGLFDRVELSYDHIWLDTRDAGRRLGIGQNTLLQLDVAGAKLRLFGDIVVDQDTWLPEVSVGAQFKAAGQHTILHEVGAREPDGVDTYLSATKLFLAHSVLVDATLRATKANQFGLLGFGGDRGRSTRVEFEGSVADLLTRHFAVGAEFRDRPSNLAFSVENPAFDVFGAYFIDKALSVTLAFLGLGTVARQTGQNGLYLSLQAGF